MFYLKPSFVVTNIVILLFALAIFTGCQNIHRNNSHPEISYSAIEEGKALADKYCQSCHALPDPSLLDSKTWETGVLPQMGPRLGIFSFNFNDYPSARFDRSLPKNFYPPTPVLELEEWQNIINYYIAASPDTLSDKSVSGASVKKVTSLFSVKTPDCKYDMPSTTLVKITKPANTPYILVSDAGNKTLYNYNKELQALDSLKTDGPIVDMELRNSLFLTCNIGVLNPNNGKFGKGRNIHINPDGKMKQDSTPLFYGLARPVQITAADLNNDGKTDYVVCEFGYLTGALSWMENQGNGKFDKHILRPLPGAIKAYINDYNKDGLADIWVLFSQGEEGIFLFTNKGNGKFEEKQILRFPPVFGSSYFEFADFNKDGYPDIVYTCGDNADYSPILKPYHGVYIFINDGLNNFKQQYFFHINGCYKAMARDFDGDGDLDIAAISFFADYSHKPEEGFVYFENQGNLTFNPYSVAGTEQGRWLTMDAGDVNGDGKTDLVLGNFSIGPSLMKSKHDWKKGPPFILLQNTGKNH